MNHNDPFQHDSSRLKGKHARHWRAGRPHHRRRSSQGHAGAGQTRIQVSWKTVLLGFIGLFVLLHFAAYNIDIPVYSLADQNDKSASDSELDEIVTTHQETGYQHWRHTASEALEFYGVDKEWTDVVMAMIEVESNGNVEIDQYQDIMQAHEGDGRSILMNGVSKKNVRATTPEASIYAGCFELSLVLAEYEHKFGHEADANDADTVGLIAQGYNYGYAGWLRYCLKNGITAWSLSASEAYQNTIGGIGTANHGAKVIKAWEKIRG